MILLYKINVFYKRILTFNSYICKVEVLLNQ
nr:MAG TPA: hypothetical protein [Bacteriophage sp.]